MKVFIRGLNACLQRKADIKRYRDYVTSNGHTLVNDPKDCDVILLWTCAFRQDMHDNSIRMINQYKTLGPELIVCGCLPSINPKAIKENFNGTTFEWKYQNEMMPKLFGKNSLDLSKFERPFVEKYVSEDLELFKKEHPESKITYTDQFIKLFISEGCRFSCSYCAERLAFPPYKSVPVKTLVAGYKEIRKTMVKQGYNKPGLNRIVLWADSSGDYGIDLGKTLPDLIEALLSIDDSIQVGIENIQPSHFIKFFNVLIDFFKRDKIFLLNLPIQSASDRVLKLMNREHGTSELDRIFSALTALGFNNCETDIIVGFPTETADEFQETIDFVIKHRLKYVKISGYLETECMESARLKGKISPEEIQRRVLVAYDRIKNAKILCSYDNNSIIKENFSKDFVEL